MTRPSHPRLHLACGLLLATTLALLPMARAQAASDTLHLDSAKVTLNGTSNVHPYEAATATVTVTKVKVAAAAGTDAVESLAGAGVIEAFDIAIPVKTLTSPKDGLDKNMWKALKADRFADITFCLTRLEKATAPGTFRGIGKLTIAGVEKEVALDLTIQRTGTTLTVKGGLALLMTDYGITPPKAMLGMLKTDPKVTIAFETVLSVA